METTLCLELRSFSIEDKDERKSLLRAILGWIIFQNCIYLPFMYYFLQLPTILTNAKTLKVVLAVYLFTSSLFYYFRNFRRSKKNAYVSLCFVTILNAILLGVIANMMDTLLILTSPIILISQLLTIIVYSMQSKLELTNFGAFIIIFAVFLTLVVSNIFIVQNSQADDLYIFLLSSCFAIYITFDIQLMLTSPLHKYQMTANEHVFGAVNLFADKSKMTWLIFRMYFLDQIIFVCRYTYKTMTSKLY